MTFGGAAQWKSKVESSASNHAPADTSPHNLSYFLGKTVNVCISLDATPISSVLLYRVTTRRKDWLRKVFGMSEVKPEAAE